MKMPLIIPKITIHRGDGGKHLGALDVVEYGDTAIGNHDELIARRLEEVHLRKVYKIPMIMRLVILIRYNQK